MRLGQSGVSAALATGLLLTACYPAPPLSPRPDGAARLNACGTPSPLASALASAIAHGHAAEDTPAGACLAKAARQGSTAATMVLADAYGAELTPQATPAALSLDLFGRHIAWLHLAAEQGNSSAQLLLAQQTDDPPYMAMTDVPLAWYQTAAEDGSPQALTVIAQAYEQGRIADIRLYELKKWLTARADRAPEYQHILQRLNAPPAHRLP